MYTQNVFLVVIQHMIRATAGPYEVFLAEYELFV